MALTHTPPGEIGFQCPDFNLPSVEGKNLSLKDLKNGNPFVVMFICNHCPYVLAIEDRLIALGHDLKKLNVNILGISSNDEISYPEDSFDKMKARAESKAYSFHYAQDKSQEVAKAFGAVCTPDFFVFDKEARLAYRGRLDDSWKDPSLVNQRELFNAVKLLLAGQNSVQPQNSSMGCSIKWIKS
jgi:peroxiredoxin